MKEETKLDSEIKLVLHKLGLETFNANNVEIVGGLITHIKNGILGLEQTQSSRHDWSISVKDIKSFFE